MGSGSKKPCSGNHHRGEGAVVGARAAVFKDVNHGW